MNVGSKELARPQMGILPYSHNYNEFFPKSKPYVPEIRGKLSSMKEKFLRNALVIPKKTGYSLTAQEFYGFLHRKKEILYE